MSDKLKALLGQFMFLAIGVGMYAYTVASDFQIRSKNDIGSGGVPKIVCGAIIALSLLKILLILGNKSLSAQAKKSDNVNNRKGIAVIAVLAAYCFAIKPVGFPLLTPPMLFAEMSLMAPGEKRNYALFAVLSIVLSTAIFAVFYYGLELMLPPGLMKKYL